MKKFFSVFSVMALVVAAMSFVSCSKDSDPVVEEPTKPEEVGKSVFYSLTVLEQYFEYGDIVLTTNIDGEEKVYTFLKDATKLDNSPELAEYYQTPKAAARVAEGKVVYEKSAKFTARFSLTEEGKKKIEAAADDAEIDLLTIFTIDGSVLKGGLKGLSLKALEANLDYINEHGVYDHTAN